MLIGIDTKMKGQQEANKRASRRANKRPAEGQQRASRGPQTRMKEQRIKKKKRK